MADDQGSNATTAWDAAVDNNIIGLFTAPGSLAPVAGVASGILQDVIPQAAIVPYRDAVLGTVWATGGAVPTYIDPLPELTLTDVTAESFATFEGQAGPTDAPLMTARFEVVMLSGVVVVIGEVPNQVFDVQKTVQASFQIPIELALHNKQARFVVYAEDDAVDQRFQSAPKVLTNINWSPIIAPRAPTVAPLPLKRVEADPQSPGVRRVKSRDFT